MTANQIEYWKLQESKRHNVETEKDNTRRTDGQLGRWKTQNGVDIANAVTGGIGNIAHAVSSIGNMITGGLSKGAGAMMGAIGF